MTPDISGGSPHPYIPNTSADRQSMLEVIGATSSDELFAEVPVAVRNPNLNLPKALSEVELKRAIREIFSKNHSNLGIRNFLGAGAFRHDVPAFIGPIAMRGEYATAYTPYQPEIAQGTLRAGFEFQTAVCELTGMEVANTGMYDGASALAEAARMASRITKREKIVLLDTVHPHSGQTVDTYAFGADLEVVRVGREDFDKIDTGTAAVLVQSPNFYGTLEDLSAWSQASHENGAQLVVSVDNPLSLGLYKPPAEYGADIVVGEIANLGNPLNFGGPYCGMFASRQEHVRQMPGHIVGRTTEIGSDKVGYVLTLVTREQFVRREGATSNICTSEALVALSSTMYLAAMGPQLRELAIDNYHRAHYAAELLKNIPGFKLPLEGQFFNEFVLECPQSPTEINKKLLQIGMFGGLDVSDSIKNGMLLSFTETNTRSDIDKLAAALANVTQK